jgi:toxin CptA
MAVRRITVKPSPRLAVGLCAAHGGAAAAIWLAPVPYWLKAGVTLVMAASLGWYLFSRVALRAAGAIVALEIREEGGLSFLTRCGEWRECRLLGSSYVSPLLTVLNLEPAGGWCARHVLLLPDNVDAKDFRRLRAWLRWAPVQRPEALGQRGRIDQPCENLTKREN